MLEGSHLGFIYEGPDPTPPRTARSTRSTSSAMRASHSQPAREMASAARHAERLSTARHSGQYRSSGGGSGSTSGGGAAAAASPGGNTLGQLFTKVQSKVGSMMQHSTSTTTR